MRTPRPVFSDLRQGAQALLGILLLSTILLSACGGDSHMQQQASQNQAKLDQLLHQAQANGVPATLLQPVIKQKQQLTSTGAPFNLFNDQPTTDYYRNIGTRYAQLAVQTQGIISSTTEQYQSQARHDVQSFDQDVSKSRSQGLQVQYFTQQLNQVQGSLSSAKYPKDYTAVSTQAHSSAQALDMMRTANGQLTTFKHTIDQMKSANLDVTAMQMQYQNDQQRLGAGKSMPDFQSLSTLLNAQYLQAAVSTNLALPYVTTAKLSDLTGKFQFLKTNGVDITTYQPAVDTDKATASKVKNVQDYISFSKQVDTDIALMHDDLVTGQAKAAIQQFHREADAFDKAHRYHNKFDNKDYSQVAGYQMDGMGARLDLELTWCYTVDDFQNMITTANDELFNLHMFEQDYNDKTAYDKVHATDTQLLDHYSLHKGQVIMVSLIEQTLRYYEDGKLVKAFLVTTGRSDRPSMPGSWLPESRESPTVFKSSDPPGSQYWYPDTPIHYAINYHHGGYFVHDSWWRKDYGPGTQYPHVDSGGDQSFSGNGSHGCVNVQEDLMQWLYGRTDMNTHVVIY